MSICKNGIKQATGPDRQWEIYVLIDPGTLEVRYVGVTHEPKSRVNNHLVQAKAGKCGYKNNWIRSLLNVGHRPLIAVIQSGFGPTWKERECYWIAHYRAAKSPLTNLTDGGEGSPGIKHPPEFGAAISLRMRGKKLSPQAVAAMRIRLTGVKQSKETIEKRMAKMRGRKQRPEVVAARAARRRGWKTPESAKIKQRAAKIGKKLGPRPQEVIEKIRAAQIGKKRKPLTSEQREKQAMALRDKPWSDERRNADTLRRALLALLVA